MVSSQESATTCIHINKLKYGVVPEHNGGFWVECPTPLTILHGNAPTQIFNNLTWGCEEPFQSLVWAKNILVFLVGKVKITAVFD